MLDTVEKPMFLLREHTYLKMFHLCLRPVVVLREKVKNISKDLRLFLTKTVSNGTCSRKTKKFFIQKIKKLCIFMHIIPATYPKGVLLGECRKPLKTKGECAMYEMKSTEKLELDKRYDYVYIVYTSCWDTLLGGLEY